MSERRGVDSPATGPTPEEFETAFNGPAAHVNRWFITTDRGVVRIGFCEQNGPDRLPHFRSAIALDHEEAVEFATMLYNFMQKRVEQMDAAYEQHIKDRLKLEWEAENFRVDPPPGAGLMTGHTMTGVKNPFREIAEQFVPKKPKGGGNG